MHGNVLIERGSSSTSSDNNVLDSLSDIPTKMASDRSDQDPTFSIIIHDASKETEAADALDVGRCETVMDLSMKKPKEEQTETQYVQILVENTEGSNETVENGLNMTQAQLRDAALSGAGDATHSKRSRSKKRKRPPQKCSKDVNLVDYVILSPSEGCIEQDEVLVNDYVISDGDHTDSSGETRASSLSTLVSESEQFSAGILANSILQSSGKSIRPFKLYTAQNRDLLAGLTVKSNMNNIAAAFSGLPVSGVPVSSTSTGILSAAGTSTLNIPFVTSNPLIPVSIPASSVSTSTSSSASNTTTLSVPTPVITSTSSSSAVRLMTLATEADKILREKASPSPDTVSSEDMPNGIKEINKLQPLRLANIDPSGKPVTANFNEDGTFDLTIESDASSETLKLIHERATAAVHAILQRQKDEAAPKEPKNKKRRGPTPDDLKTTAYWERRRKNNQAAKRSRDARRAKEDQIAIRAALLEQENVALKIEIAALKDEVKHLRSIAYIDRRDQESNDVKHKQ